MPTGLAGDPKELTPRYVTQRARELEQRDFAVGQMIGNRLDLYYVQWRVPRRPGREYVPHPMGRFVMDRAIDKLLAMPHRLHVAPDPDLLTPEDLAELERECQTGSRGESETGRVGEWESGRLRDRRAQRRALEELAAEEAQWRADRAEMALGRLLGRAEEDGGLDLTEAVVWTAVVAGYAGPTRVAYDESAAGDESPFVVQALDRRFYHEERGAHGPEEVVYSRRGRLKDLQAEGWRLDLPGRPDSPAALHDYWRVRRVPDGPGRWRKEVWHAIVVEVTGPSGPSSGSGRAGRTWGAFAKPPTRMPLEAIPYAVRLVRPTVIRLPEFDAFEVNAFADVLWLLFEPMSRVLSWSHQLSRLAADPNVTVKAPMGTGVDVDVTTPGAQNTVPEGTEVQINLDPAQAQIIASQGGRLQDLADKATFSGATLGQGIHQASGLMTSRLQEAGAESLISTRKACMGVVADTYRHLAMVARAYAPGSVQVLSGRERISVELPGISRQEAIRLLTDVRRATEPDARGVGLVSEDTGLELVGLPYPALEERKKQRQARVWGGRDGETG